jgi:hypothetical protein
MKAVRKRRLSRGWKVLIIIVGVLLVLWIASEIAIPLIADNYIKGEITKKYPEAKDVSVSVSAFPALRLAFKDYSSLTVKVNGITLEGINFDRIVLRSKKWPDGTFAATVLPGEVMRFFSSTHSYVLSPSLAISNGQIQVSGRMNLGYATVNITATGKLVARGEGKQVYFVPTDIAITGVSNTVRATQVIRDIMAGNPVFTIREDLPFTVTAVTAVNNRITVRGDVDLSKALNITL